MGRNRDVHILQNRRVLEMSMATKVNSLIKNYFVGMLKNVESVRGHKTRRQMDISLKQYHWCDK